MAAKGKATATPVVVNDALNLSITTDEDGRLVIGRAREDDAAPKAEPAPPQPGPPGRAVVKTEINSLGQLIFWFSDDTQENLGLVVGEKAKPGINGRGVIGAEVNAAGNLVLKMSVDGDIDAGRVLGDPGKNADPAPPARGVSGALVNADGELVLRYTDATEQNVGRVAGKPGDKPDDGKDGRSVTSASIDAAGHLILSFSDETVTDLGKIVPDAPKPLPIPENGKDGRSILSAELNSEGHLVLRFSDDAEQDIGKVTGPPGKRGAPGSAIATTFLDHGEWSPAPASSLWRAVIIGEGGGGSEDQGGEAGQFVDTGWLAISEHAFPAKVEIGRGGFPSEKGRSTTIGRFTASGGRPGQEVRPLNPPDAGVRPSNGGGRDVPPGANLIDPSNPPIGSIPGLTGLGGSGGHPGKGGGIRGGGGGSGAAGGQGSVDVFEI